MKRQHEWMIIRWRRKLYLSIKKRIYDLLVRSIITFSKNIYLGTSTAGTDPEAKRSKNIEKRTIAHEEWILKKRPRDNHQKKGNNQEKEGLGWNRRFNFNITLFVMVELHVISYS